MAGYKNLDQLPLTYPEDYPSARVKKILERFYKSFDRDKVFLLILEDKANTFHDGRGIPNGLRNTYVANDILIERKIIELIHLYAYTFETGLTDNDEHTDEDKQTIRLDAERDTLRAALQEIELLPLRTYDFEFQQPDKTQKIKKTILETSQYQNRYSREILASFAEMIEAFYEIGTDTQVLGEMLTATLKKISIRNFAVSLFMEEHRLKESGKFTLLEIFVELQRILRELKDFLKQGDYSPQDVAELQDLLEAQLTLMENDAQEDFSMGNILAILNEKDVDQAYVEAVTAYLSERKIRGLKAKKRRKAAKQVKGEFKQEIGKTNVKPELQESFQLALQKQIPSILTIINLAIHKAIEST